MADLITTPTFIFSQMESTILNQQPILVKYYDNEIILAQDGAEISIDPKNIRPLLREILKHEGEAGIWIRNN